MYKTLSSPQSREQVATAHRWNKTKTLINENIRDWLTIYTRRCELLIVISALNAHTRIPSKVATRLLAIIIYTFRPFEFVVMLAAQLWSRSLRTAAWKSREGKKIFCRGRSNSNRSYICRKESIYTPSLALLLTRANFFTFTYFPCRNFKKFRSQRDCLCDGS